MNKLDAEKLLADAIILERAARVLDRTSRGEPFNFSSVHWMDMKETLREVAQAKRTEAESYAGERTGSGRDGSGAEEED